MKKLFFAVGFFCFISGAAELSQPVAEYRTAVWDMRKLNTGHHRAVVRVSEEAEAVAVRIPWRRRDDDPQKKAILAFTEDHKPVYNLVPRTIEKEYGELIFQPTAGAGIYYFYYLPFKTPTVWSSRSGSYYSPMSRANSKWIADGDLRKVDPGTLQQAELVALEAIDDFNRFDPMEICATKAETEALRAECPADAPFMVFPEDRTRSIRMPEALPVDWITRGESREFKGIARPNENYAFQIGVWAAKGEVKNITADWQDFVNAAGSKIPADAMACLNFGGIDWDAKPFEKAVDIPADRVQPLWFFLTVPADAAGVYEATINLKSGGKTVPVKISLDIQGELLVDGGVSKPELMTRLSWFNSTAGQENTVTSPYTPLEIKGNTIGILNRSVQFGDNGMPVSIKSNDRELLAAPVSFDVITDKGGLKFDNWQSETVAESETTMKRQFTAKSGDVTLKLVLQMEFDGMVRYQATVKSDHELKIKDIRLITDIRADEAIYGMGFGRRGGYLPKSIDWKWNLGEASHMLWLGNVKAGLQLKLTPLNAHILQRSTLNDNGLPPGWHNDGKGGATVRTTEKTVRITAFSGERNIKKNEELEFGFHYLITPFRPLDFKNHWARRRGGWPGIPGNNIRSLFHGVRGNKFINYPFIDAGETYAVIADLKRNQSEIELYYTLRELSNRAYELWAIRSLGNEIFASSAFVYSIHDAKRITTNGGGYPWLQEHLKTDYVPSWLQPLDGNTIKPPLNVVDASISVKGSSRMANYYIAGIPYLMKKFGIRDIYLDGVGFNRETARRLARVTRETNLESLINFHCVDYFDFTKTNSSVMNNHLELLPYFSDLWLGEMFDYSRSPDFWLVEMSGIPFGLTGEQLNGSNAGNFFRGMIFGMNWRKNQETTSMWQMWDQFKIAESEMIGYWDDNPPVKTDSPNVLATVYKRAGAALVVLAHWSDVQMAKTVNLHPAVQSPVIDGELNDPAWANSVLLQDFMKMNFALKADLPFEFRLTFDQNNLYAAFRCPGNSPPKAVKRDRDGTLWLDDSIDFVIQPDPSKPGSYHFIGNAAGSIYDSGPGGVSWNGSWQYKVSQSGNDWQGEISIPLRELGLSANKLLAGGKIGFNAGRTAHVKPGEALSSSYTKTSGTYDSNFAIVTFDRSIPVTRETVAASSDTRCNLSIDWKALGLNPAKVRASLMDIPLIQKPGAIDVNNTITVPENKGYFILLEETE